VEEEVANLNALYHASKVQDQDYLNQHKALSKELRRLQKEEKSGVFPFCSLSNDTHNSG
jgi:hypothetical protein